MELACTKDIWIMFLLFVLLVVCLFIYLPGSSEMLFSSAATTIYLTIFSIIMFACVCVGVLCAYVRACTLPDTRMDGMGKKILTIYESTEQSTEHSKQHSFRVYYV